MPRLAREIRKEIIRVVSKNGGHLSSNLGVVELTIALHRVFDSPADAILFDVSHQCYTHKLLTGRYGRFGTLRKRGGISGFSRASESPHDFFDWGHASTSISAGAGMALGRMLQKKSGKVVAVIGDGAITGGMAFEALSHAGQRAKNLIVVLNDNQLSIGPNTGSISKHLSRLTMTPPYQTFRASVDRLAGKIPLLSGPLQKFIFRFKRGLKGLLLANNFFSDLGFEYVGPLDGHNITEMEAVFRRVKKLNLPVAVHVVTKKGKGYVPAEDDPIGFHGVGGQRVNPAPETRSGPAPTPETFSGAFSRAMLREARSFPNLAAITAAMTRGTGLSAFAQAHPDRFFDVGIAEQHAVGFAAGLAREGMLPVAAIYSTFMQRSIDQVIHDVALQNLPVVFALDRAGAVPDDGATHQGIFDITLLLPAPNLALLAPASAAELGLCLRWALESRAPVALRYPKNNCPAEHPSFLLPLERGRGVLLKRDEYAPDEAAPPGEGAPLSGLSCLLVCTGGIFPETREAASALSRDGASVDIYNLRFLKPIDETWFLKTASGYGAVLFVEDGVKFGGIGVHLERLVQKYLPGKRTLALGFPDRFIPQGARGEVLEEAGLSPQGIAASVRRIWKRVD